MGLKGILGGWSYKEIWVEGVERKQEILYFLNLKI